MITALDGLGEPLTIYTSRPDLVIAPLARLRGAPAGARPERGGLGHVRRVLWMQTSLRLALRRDPPRALLNMAPEGILATSIPQVTVVHDVVPLLYPEQYPRPQYYYRYVLPRLFAACRAVIVSSESTRRDVLRFYGLPEATVHVVPCGVDHGRFAPGGDDESPPGDGSPRASRPGVEPYALFVGNVMPHKNLLRLMEAFALLRQRLAARLVVRGWGRSVNVAPLRDTIDALGLAEAVDWQPYADADELAALYRGARMLVLPSLSEGFGLPALEAMASGTPVVASNVASLPEVVGEAALCVDPTDVRALADAMERLFTDDALAKELRARGLARAQLFSWERTARGVQAVLRSAA